MDKINHQKNFINSLFVDVMVICCHFPFSIFPYFFPIFPIFSMLSSTFSANFPTIFCTLYGVLSDFQRICLNKCWDRYILTFCGLYILHLLSGWCRLDAIVNLRRVPVIEVWAIQWMENVMCENVWDSECGYSYLIRVL